MFSHPLGRGRSVLEEIQILVVCVISYSPGPLWRFLCLYYIVYVSVLPSPISLYLCVYLSSLLLDTPSVIILLHFM